MILWMFQLSEILDTQRVNISIACEGRHISCLGLMPGWQDQQSTSWNSKQDITGHKVTSFKMFLNKILDRTPILHCRMAGGCIENFLKSPLSNSFPAHGCTSFNYMYNIWMYRGIITTLDSIDFRSGLAGVLHHSVKLQTLHQDTSLRWRVDKSCWTSLAWWRRLHLSRVLARAS
jgi:hypothetical protein